MQACDKLGAIRRVAIADDVMNTSATLDALCQCLKTAYMNWRGSMRGIWLEQTKNGTNLQWDRLAMLVPASLCLEGNRGRRYRNASELILDGPVGNTPVLVKNTRG